jgi:ABC-type glycerol-3-phosphate transport system substrate-binding protein
MTRARRRGVGCGAGRLVGLAAWLLAGSAACGDGTAGQVVTLTYYRHDDVAVAAADNQALAAYAAAHPTVKIEVKVFNYNTLLGLLESELKGGTTRADLINMPPSYACGYAAQLATLPASVITPEQAAARFLEAPLQGVTCGAELKGLPREYNLEYGGILVNMTRYRAKLPGRSPAQWQTWADVVSDAKALTEYDENGNVKVAGLDFRHRAPVKHILLALIVQQQGQSFWTADRRGFQFDTAETRAAVQWFVDAAQTHRYLDPKQPASVTGPWALALVNDRAAMVYTGTWGHAIAVEAARTQGKTLELAYFRHPPFFGTEHVFVQNSGWSLVVPRSSPHQERALEVVRSLTTDPPMVREWNRLAGSISPLQVHATTEALASDPVLSPIQPLLAKGQWMGYLPPVPLTDTRDSMYNNVTDAMRGTRTRANVEQPFTVDDAVRALHQECNTILSQNQQ